MNKTNNANYFNYSSSDEECELISSRHQNRDTKLWDSFQDPPEPQTSGSTANTHQFETFIRCLKAFVYIFVFAVILAGSVCSKMTIILMTTYMQWNHQDTRYCDNLNPEKELYAIIPEIQRIGWIWAIVFAFMTPEMGLLIRAARICFFRNIPRPSLADFAIVCTMECMHVIGLALLAFTVLPRLDVIKGIMLTNSVCLIPGILGILSQSIKMQRQQRNLVLNIIAVVAQVTGLFVWPLLSDEPLLWTTPIAILLISCRWWENYISVESPLGYIRNLATRKSLLAESRYYMYLYIVPIKVILFICAAIILNEVNVYQFFVDIVSGWKLHDIEIKEIIPLYSESTDTVNTSIQSSHLIILWIFLVHIASSYVTYVFSKFACKIHIQTFSFSFPICLTTPVVVSVVIFLCGMRAADVCAFHNHFPDYLFFKAPPVTSLGDYLLNDYIWVWLLWLFSQLWITKHIWTPRNDRNATTEQLFVTPMYSSLLVDQCVSMNRRRQDQEKVVRKKDILKTVEQLENENPIDTHAEKNSHHDNQPHDKIPQVFVCATMWHENRDEMMEFLKSILRLDEDQCARRMAMKYIQDGADEIDNEYYELETHIFFDDAFVGGKSKPAETLDTAPMNAYVKLLVNSLEEAARDVYKTNIKIYAPTKIVTPYGGRLIWTLPGHTKMIAHLKDINKIRHKKRWSQVMYMYYLLGYRIMQRDISPERKMTIAQNTYLLALDGDIDFQPNAVQLLLGRMKIDPDLGAACGRIHPVGQGAMVWYQVFEYAIGHWLQKATEHVIGCVLCSPGCFSLFRGRALMENSVMRKYTTKSETALHHVQYDQGEDRWLCTLLLKQKFRVEYSAASDAYTHAPEKFNEFYNQRRRWIPSTLANIVDLLGDAKTIVQKNNSISLPFIVYQACLIVGTILGPGTIFLMMVGALVSVFSIDIWTSFLWNFIPLAIFMLICYFSKQKYQLVAAFAISAVYALVMMAVMIGIIIQVMDDGIFSPSSVFFFTVVGQIIITAFLHPQEMGALMYGIVYYVTIPSMYMLLVIYALFNMNDVSWGTRENPQPLQQNEAKQEMKAPETRMQRLFSFLAPKNEEKGSVDISFAGLFRCMLCTHTDTNNEHDHLLHIADQLSEINRKMRDLELRVAGDLIVMQSDDDDDDNVGVIAKQPTELQLKRESLEEAELANYLPDWLYDVDLKNSETETLSHVEEQFWIDLIEKYLKPIEMNEKEREEVKDSLKTLRDIMVFAFVMLNALFVLIVFLLQLKKSYLHIQWPFNAKNTIVYDLESNEILISREYLELEPIGLLFVLFFGVILIIQFFAMLVHRFGTISQILATTQINWRCEKDNDDCTPDEELRGAAIEIARKLQRPQPQWDENDMEEMQQEIGRRDTIHKILYQHSNSKDWSNLEMNFKRRYLKGGDLNLGRFTVSQKTLSLLETKRKSFVQERLLRKSQLVQRTSSAMYDGGLKTAQWIEEQQRLPAPSPPEYRRADNNDGYNATAFVNQAYEVADDDDYDDYELEDNIEPAKEENVRSRPSKVTFL